MGINQMDAKAKKRNGLSKAEYLEELESESHTLRTVQAMCEESLDPDTFGKWELVRDTLKATRRAFQCPDCTRSFHCDSSCEKYAEKPD